MAKQANHFHWLENPVFRREMLIRWRHPTSFLLVIAYALVITAIVGWQVYDVPVTGDDTARLGHDIWQSLSVTQAIGWILLGPILTAGAIATEREKGHLDILRLSPLSAHDIVYGKLFGALSLVILLLLVPLPAIALCFLLGGVSPLEFLSSFLFNFCTALSALSFGLAASAKSTGSNHAVFVAIGRGLVAQIFFLVCQFVLCCLPFVSPVLTLIILLEARSDKTLLLLIPYALVQLYVTRSEAQVAMQAVSQTRFTPTTQIPYSPPPYYTTPHSISNTATTISNTATTASQSKRGPLTRAPHWLRFANPVLQREARALIQFKWSSDATTNDALITVIAIGFMIWTLPLTLVVWFEPKRTQEIWWLVSLPWLICIILAAALTSAGSFTRERESGHWPMLWLTPLHHHEIIGGKLFGILIGITYWSLCLLPFWIPCFFRISIPTIAVTFLIAISSTWLAVNIGLCFSAMFKKSSNALNATILALLIWWFSHAPWDNWQNMRLKESLTYSFTLFSIGIFLFGATYRILHRAPYEN